MPTHCQPVFTKSIATIAGDFRLIDSLL